MLEISTCRLTSQAAGDNNAMKNPLTITLSLLEAIVVLGIKKSN